MYTSSSSKSPTLPIHRPTTATYNTRATAPINSHNSRHSNKQQSCFSFLHVLLLFALVFFILNFFIFFNAVNNYNVVNKNKNNGENGNGGILSYVEHKFLNIDSSKTLTQLLEAMKRVDEGHIEPGKLTGDIHNNNNNNIVNNDNNNNNNNILEKSKDKNTLNKVNSNNNNNDDDTGNVLQLDDQPQQQTKPTIPVAANTKQNDRNSKNNSKHYYRDPIVLKKPSKFDEHMIKVNKMQSEQDLQKNDKGCGHTLDRDYRVNPVRVAGLFSDEWKGCAVRCVSAGHQSEFPPDVSTGRGGSSYDCPHTKHYSYSMENIPMDSMRGDGRTLVGTTRLNSDIPVPYYSWAEYNYMMQPKPKTGGAMMAAFISNCSSQKRLQILKDLMSYGVTVHSFGRCMTNAAIPPEFRGGYLDQKTAVTSTYKFTFAAENSETDDYVTEKLFGTLSSGSIPVYLGAPNVMKFAPSAKSVINVSSFNSTKHLAEFLLSLDRDDAKYQEFLQWKKDGPSADFNAVVDRAIVHSSCRLCIRVADYQRAMYGNMVGHEQKKAQKQVGELALRVRPRGEFYMKYVYLKPTEQNLDSLYQKILTLYSDHVPAVGDVHSVFRLWDRLERPIEDEDFKNGVLEEDMELEIIFTYPVHPERGEYYKWQLQTGKAP